MLSIFLKKIIMKDNIMDTYIIDVMKKLIKTNKLMWNGFFNGLVETKSWLDKQKWIIILFYYFGWEIVKCYDIKKEKKIK